MRSAVFITITDQPHTMELMMWRNMDEAVRDFFLVLVSTGVIVLIFPLVLVHVFMLIFGIGA